MKLIIEGTPEEIAALVAAIQERQKSDIKEMMIMEISKNMLDKTKINIKYV